MKNDPVEVFRSNGGQLRMTEALDRGISRFMLYKMRDTGVVEQVSRGVFRLFDLPLIGNPDLVTVSLRFPNAVICLVSALSYHEITTQIPHAVSIAVSRDSRVPRLKFPPISPHRFSKLAFEAGIEVHRIDGADVKIYSIEKTIADCFKFRNKIGMDVVLEALKLYRHKKLNRSELQKFARICRVENVMRPYLEASI